MSDPGLDEMRAAFRRLAERQELQGIAFKVQPHPLPRTGREVLQLFFGEPHGSHTVVGLSKRHRAVIVHCSCGISWLLDEARCKRTKVEFHAVELALRHAQTADKS